MKDLDVSQESIKILEEDIGSNLFDISHSNFFSRHITKGKGNKSKNELLGIHQDEKLFCTAKETVIKTKATHTMGEDICK